MHTSDQKSESTFGDAPNDQREVMWENVPYPKPASTIYCQLAHGSPVHYISEFSNNGDLYSKIANRFNVPVEDILFCTLNTRSADMTKLLRDKAGFNDVITAHLKGRPKLVEIIPTQPLHGMILTDNGVGYVLIERFNDDNNIKRIGNIFTGDHIEKINDVSLVGKCHIDIERVLLQMRVGTKFTLRLNEPRDRFFAEVGPRGIATLLFKAGGDYVKKETKDLSKEVVIIAINSLLVQFLGIDDEELAEQFLALAPGKKNFFQFQQAINNSDLKGFAISEEFITQIWYVIPAACYRRMPTN